MSKARLIHELNEVLKQDYGVEQAIEDPMTVRDLAIIVQALKRREGEERAIGPMTQTPTDLKHVIVIVGAVVRNIHLKRALHETDSEPRLNFWRLIYGNCLDMAVIDWCKLFGSDNEKQQPVHWKNVVPMADQDKFRAGLLTAAGLTEDDWREYWKSIKDYRDKHAAHFDENFLKESRYPDLTIALETAYFYYEQILAIMKDRSIIHAYPEDIRDYSRRFAGQASEAAKFALASTTSIREEVG